jgi:hypothetical protein
VSTLWAISSGDYSDYSVNAVFDTEEDARAAIALGLGERLEEMDYYRAGDTPVKREIWQAHSGRINADGSMAIPANEAGRMTPWVPSSRPDRPKVTEERENGGIWITVEAPSKEMAEKVLHDRVAKARAELLGL